MTRPIPGKPYTAQSGDTLPKIAARAYGLSEKWSLIRNANQFEFETETDEDVQPGEKLYIPVDPDLVFLQNNKA
jgi:nucleoid-associated protein YgaU